MRRLFLFSVCTMLFCLSVQAVDFSRQAGTPSSHQFFVSGLQRYATLKKIPEKYFGISKLVEYNPTAVALGYLYAKERMTAGVTFSFGTGDVKTYTQPEVEMKKVNLQDWGLTLFGTYTAASNWYGKGSLTADFTRSSIKNQPALGVGHGNNFNFAASLEFGKHFELASCLRITPHVGIDYAYMTRVEVLTDFDYDHILPEQNFWEFPIGITVAKDFQVSDWRITPSIDGALVMATTVKNDSMGLRAGFAARTGSEWKVYGLGSNKWGGRVTAGITARKSRADVGINYSFEIRKQYREHRITAAVGFNF